MPSTNLQHRRTHNLLLINKLLNQRDASSPFTLVFDNLEQSGKGIIAEYLRRAKVAKVKTVFVSFETLGQLQNVDVYIQTWKYQSVAAWQKEVAFHTRPPPPSTTMLATPANAQKTLLILDSLNSLPASTTPLPTFLISLLSPTTSLLSVYHLDIPSSLPPPYHPSLLTTLKFLATTILTPHSLHHVLERKAARDRSLPEPLFGLAEAVHGLVVAGRPSGGAGVKINDADGGVVIEMEHRRRSGRGVREWFFLPDSLGTVSTFAVGGAGKTSNVTLLEDHPLYRSPSDEGAVGGGGADDELISTFELNLSEKQRRDREGVVLPYYDAQRADGAGPGEGGRILYDMGAEDDFDEEEDEI
ncbi:hypothetical protein K431DRAFT_288106 [Polychaeton citri CBS 116435]|uniref:Elongator complex protein 5 n=1 Tax=Polychaeton citri CBS 116435 TaxID=1314669 RepID=A0A9P4PZU8_9PEZI|nr:hypothetical protein K431DRAFT_288106 [Polychaeton citri CBS 116435]